MENLSALKALWSGASMRIAPLASPDALAKFQSTTGLVLPQELADYFLTVNGTDAQYDESFFAFNSLATFESIAARFHDYHGSPDYSFLLNTFSNCDTCYVFADFIIHTFAYAIQLHKDSKASNEVYVLYGGEYHVIAHSFSEFISKHLLDPYVLQYPDELPRQVTV